MDVLHEIEESQPGRYLPVSGEVDPSISCKTYLVCIKTYIYLAGAMLKFDDGRG